MSNVKEISISTTEPTSVKFTQYDTGQKLYVKNSPGFDFTTTTELQITDGTESAARYQFTPYGVGGIVDLPDTIFQTAGILKGYIFTIDSDGHTTEAQIYIGIRERTAYNGYISDATEEVVVAAGFEVTQNDGSVTVTATNTDGTTTEATVYDGEQGDAGEDGVSPTASVEQTTDGALITVTDASGTTTATISNGTAGEDGTSPTATVTQTDTGAEISITDINGTTTATITNGSNGDTGATPSITVTASVDDTTGTPAVTVTQSGTDEAPVIDLAFTGLKGESGSGGSSSGTVVWVETSEASPAAPYRTLTTDAIEAAEGQGTITPTYRFFDEDTQEYKTVTVTIVANYNMPATTQKIDTVYLTENITSSETIGTLYPAVSVDSISFDDAGVEDYSSISLVNPTISNGKIYAYLPSTIEFVYNQTSVTASYTGEFARQQVGTYQHTQTATKYSLGTQS